MTDQETVAVIEPLRDLFASVCAAATAVRGTAGEPPTPPRLERSRHESQGDYSTNAAMLLAPFRVETVAAEQAGGLAAAAGLYGEEWTRGVIDG